jgi:hypothetical protein
MPWARVGATADAASAQRASGRGRASDEGSARSARRAPPLTCPVVMENIVERIAILDDRLDRLGRLIARLRAANADTTELERSRQVAAEARAGYLQRLRQLEAVDGASADR